METPLKLPKDLKAIIFDFDGTLVDSEPIWYKSFQEIFGSEFGVQIPQELMFKHTGMGVTQTTSSLCEEFSLDVSQDLIKELVEKVNNTTHKKILGEIPLREGAIELMEWAAKNDIVMGICSASTQDMLETFVEQRGLSVFIKQIASMVGIPSEQQKPSPYPYSHTLELLNVKAEHSIAFEDSPAGIESAVTAGITTFGITTIGAESKLDALKVNPHAIIKSFLEVVPLLSDESQ